MIVQNTFYVTLPSVGYIHMQEFLDLCQRVMNFNFKTYHTFNLVRCYCSPLIQYYMVNKRRKLDKGKQKRSLLSVKTCHLMNIYFSKDFRKMFLANGRDPTTDVPFETYGQANASFSLRYKI